MDYEMEDVDNMQPVYSGDVDEIPTTKTSFSQPSTSSSISNTDINTANTELSKASLPDIDTIIENKLQGRKAVINKNILAKIIAIEKPKNQEELDKAVKTYNEVTRAKLVYSDLVGIQTPEQLQAALPDVPSDTPGVDLTTQNKIGVALSRLNIFSGFDHSKFIPLENGGLSVMTSKGSIRLTQVSNPELFLQNPNIPQPEYKSLFGITRSEYFQRVGENNNKIVAPADEKLDTAINVWAPQFLDRLQSRRQASEFNYRQLAEKYEMTELDKQEGRLPERELVAIDQRFQTLEGQIQVATSKAVDVQEQIKALEDKSDKTPEDLTKLQRLRDELDGHEEVLANLKGDYRDNLAKMRKQRNIVLGITGVLAGGGILAAIFEAVANALGSDTAKDLLPKSTDPKDIAESGIGKIVKKKLEDLAAYFHDNYLNSSGAVQAFWHMMENAVDFLQSNLWLIVAAALALLAVEMNKKS